VCCWQIKLLLSNSEDLTKDKQNSEDLFPYAHQYLEGNVIIHKEKSNNMQQCIRILLFHIYVKPNMFGRHTTHHQEPKTTLAASSFSYV
jgi:hypothetical protein